MSLKAPVDNFVNWVAAATMQSDTPTQVQAQTQTMFLICRIRGPGQVSFCFVALAFGSGEILLSGSYVFLDASHELFGGRVVHDCALELVDTGGHELFCPKSDPILASRLL